MDLQKDYDKLYQHWLQEFQQTDLTQFNEELFTYYKQILNSINDYKEEKRDDLKDQIFKTYKENINFLFNDFLKIRENKIINSALKMTEINFNNVIEAEKLLFQNLISSIKGYNKVKVISLYEKEVQSPIEGDFQQKLDSKSSEVNNISLNKEKELSIADSEAIADKEKIDYTLIRFLKKTPPLVGIDLLSYGPFEKEDIANIPQKNAEILIIEKFAEKIELT